MDIRPLAEAVMETAGKIKNDNMPDQDFYKFQFVDLKQNTVPYIAVMRFGAWLLIFCERSSIE